MVTDPPNDPFYNPGETGQVDRLLATIEFSKALVSAYDMETLLSAILERIKAIIPARELVLIADRSPNRRTVFRRDRGTGSGKGEEYPPEARGRDRRDRGANGTADLYPRRGPGPAFAGRVDTQTGFDTRSIIALPLVVRGEVIGVFEVVNVAEERFFREKYLPHLTILADYVAIAVDNVRNLQKLEARTFIDEVTGYYNTRYLIHELDRLIPQVLEQHDHFSVVFLDLDNFKTVVDSHGHLRGSKVLAQVARVIHEVLGPDDSLVRYGGDEFIVLMPRRSQSGALEITRRLRRHLNQTPFLRDEGLEVKVTASYGIATLPEDAQDREKLLLIADRAMFGSKGRGRDRIMVGQDLVPVAND